MEVQCRESSLVKWYIREDGVLNKTMLKKTIGGAKLTYDELRTSLIEI